MMPGADGIEVLRVAKEVDENVHVILVTGFASLETAMEAIKKGAYDYITKPFKLEEIKVAVQNVCEKIQLVRKNQELVDSLTQAYDDIEGLKESRDELSVQFDTINEKMEEHRNSCGKYYQLTNGPQWVTAFLLFEKETV